MTNQTDFLNSVSLPENWASDWKLTARLGAGAYSTVYRAIRKDHPSIDAAIKVIAIPASQAEADNLREEGFDADQSQSYYDDIARQYISEIELLERFKGTQNIVSIEDYKLQRKKDSIGNEIFIRMELLTALDSILRERVLSEEESIQIGIDICGALELCEASNIIHRDIKPANIFVNNKTPGHVFYKLGDFGIARSIQGIAGGLSTKGTPNYMAPEVFLKKPYDHRVDLYSLGITLYRLLNQNTLPFIPIRDYSASAREKALAARLEGKKLPPPCGAATQTAEVILKACAYNPDDRYRSATEMKAALQALLNRRNTDTPSMFSDNTMDDADRTVVLPEPAKPSVPLSGAPESSSSSRSPEPVSDKAAGKSKKKVLLPVLAGLGLGLAAGLYLLFGPKEAPRPVQPQETVIFSENPAPESTPESTEPPAAATTERTEEPTASPTPERNESSETAAPTAFSAPDSAEAIVSEQPSPLAPEMAVVQVLPGDVNQDGVSDLRDVIRLQKVIAEMESEYDTVEADFNADGIINLQDLIRLQKWIAEGNR